MRDGDIVLDGNSWFEKQTPTKLTKLLTSRTPFESDELIHHSIWSVRTVFVRERGEEMVKKMMSLIRRKTFVVLYGETTIKGNSDVQIKRV
jgi:hypothetical protein